MIEERVATVGVVAIGNVGNSRSAIRSSFGGPGLGIHRRVGQCD